MLQRESRAWWSMPCPQKAVALASYRLRSRLPSASQLEAKNGVPFVELQTYPEIAVPHFLWSVLHPYNVGKTYLKQALMQAIFWSQKWVNELLNEEQRASEEVRGPPHHVPADALS